MQLNSPQTSTKEERENAHTKAESIVMEQPSQENLHTLTSPLQP